MYKKRGEISVKQVTTVGTYTLPAMVCSSQNYLDKAAQTGSSGPHIDRRVLNTNIQKKRVSFTTFWHKGSIFPVFSVCTEFIKVHLFSSKKIQ